VISQKYLQGYHGLVKTFVGTAAYYYQDELGSTSHLAGGTGALIESYHYDLYGKPRVYTASGVYQPSATPQAKDLFTGQRWVSEIGLYDDRNRFMSPDLGRFLQPDPIGFKGDASNLYRYCGNDWANRTDPMGLNYYDPDEYRTEAQGRYNIVNFISHPGFEQFGNVPVGRSIQVVPKEGHLILTRYDVTVGKRTIALGTPTGGARKDIEVGFTKQHEDKHPADAKALWEKYKNSLNKPIGQYSSKEDPHAAAAKAATKLANEFDTRMAHQPRSEWQKILEGEGRSKKQVDDLYRNAKAVGLAASQSNSNQSSNSPQASNAEPSGDVSVVSDSGIVFGAGNGRPGPVP
jgi:RHS repeat-associated protein